MAEQVGGLTSLWRRALGSSPAAGRARRWGLILGLLFGAGIGVLQVPADPGQMLTYLLSARVFGHLIALGLGFWLALRAAASVQQAIFQLDRPRQAQRHVLNSAFNLFASSLVIRNGAAQPDDTNLALIRIGGPGRARISMENAAVFEDAAGQPRVLGPGPAPQALGSFERLHEVIDLRDQVLNLSLWGRTRDGIRVQVEGARVVYSVGRGLQEPSLEEPHPFEEQAALRLAYEQRVEGGAIAFRRARAQSRLAVQGAAFFERQLQAFISELTLGEMLALPSSAPATDEPQSGSLFLAREAIRTLFAAGCEEPAARMGLQLQWIDVGAWKVDALAQEILEEYLEEQDSEFSAIRDNPYQESRAQELNRLFAQLAEIDPAKLDQLERPAAYAQLLNAFYGLFDGLKLHYGEGLGRDERHVDVVLSYLQSLARRLDRQTE